MFTDFVAGSVRQVLQEDPRNEKGVRFNVPLVCSLLIDLFDVSLLLSTTTNDLNMSISPVSLCPAYSSFFFPYSVILRVHLFPVSCTIRPHTSVSCFLLLLRYHMEVQQTDKHNYLRFSLPGQNTRVCLQYRYSSAWLGTAADCCCSPIP